MWLPRTGANGFGGLTGSGNGKEKLREVVEVCMYMQPEISSQYKTAQ
jgi:hypothetical protein